MIGVKSTQHYHILKHELEEDQLPRLLQLQKDVGLAGELVYKREYVTGLYDINPNVVHLRQENDANDGPVVKYDPIEVLVQEVDACKYLGSWEDPDILMDSPYGYSRTLACGRWELAVSHICPDKLPALNPEPEMTVDDLIDDAKSREVVDHNKNVQDKTLE